MVFLSSWAPEMQRLTQTPLLRSPAWRAHQAQDDKVLVVSPGAWASKYRSIAPMFLANSCWVSRIYWPGTAFKREELVAIVGAQLHLNLCIKQTPCMTCLFIYNFIIVVSWLSKWYRFWVGTGVPALCWIKKYELQRWWNSMQEQTKSPHWIETFEVFSLLESRHQ